MVDAHVLHDGCDSRKYFFSLPPSFPQMPCWKYDLSPWVKARRAAARTPTNELVSIPSRVNERRSGARRPVGRGTVSHMETLFELTTDRRSVQQSQTSEKGPPRRVALSNHSVLRSRSVVPHHTPCRCIAAGIDDQSSLHAFCTLHVSHIDFAAMYPIGFDCFGKNVSAPCPLHAA